MVEKYGVTGVGGRGIGWRAGLLVRTDHHPASDLRSSFGCLVRPNLFVKDHMLSGIGNVSACHRNEFFSLVMKFYVCHGQGQASLFPLAQFCTSMMWGVISDKTGRKVNPLHFRCLNHYENEHAIWFCDCRIIQCTVSYRMHQLICIKDAVHSVQGSKG